MPTFTHRGFALFPLMAVLVGLCPAHPAVAAGTESPYPHGTYRGDCTQCHGRDSWSPAVFTEGWSHEKLGFPLTGSHLKVTCRGCHKTLEFALVSRTCGGCHKDPHDGTLGTDCSRCHQPGSFQDRAAFVQMHRLTRLPLTGSHAGLDCEACHPSATPTNRTYAGTSFECQACHLSLYEATVDPNHARAGFSRDCSACHTPAQWQGATFDHARFPLTGGHQSVRCAQCHVSGPYSETSQECYSCHQRDFDGTTNPDHRQNGITRDCVQCHDFNAWEGAPFDHTSFPLTAGHHGLTCDRCHQTGSYRGTSTDCFSCHKDDYASTARLDHTAAGFPHTCTNCHTTSTWLNTTFEHATFALTAAHASAACLECHKNNIYKNTPSDCFSCHAEDYQGTTDPAHAALDYPRDCTQCHSNIGWGSASFDHTRFPLTGNHLVARCTQCHSGGIYRGTSAECWSCHQGDFTRAADPNHGNAGFSHDCTQCHTTSGWSGGIFLHTLFPLTGGHSDRRCIQCHGNGVYQGTLTACYGCHQADYVGATNPSHTAAGFPQECSTCHSIAGWNGAQFDHTYFPLTGGHAGRTCIQCHGNGIYHGTSALCYSCHQTDYQGTTNPNHTQAGFAHECATCHTIGAWAGATFDHTLFPLTGGHAGPTCIQCHGDGIYHGASTLCYSCHLTDYQGTANPNHTQAGFAHECNTCHTITAWAGATFDHTLFPLTGGHAGPTCIQCHANGVYHGTSALCYSCHQADYQSTTNPNHSQAGFPHECNTCHTIDVWAGATFEHTLFPLTGGHAGRTCNQCHANGIFQGTPAACWSCHEADYQATTDPNHTQAGIAHECNTCHSIDAWAGATFVHTLFPLTGGHAGRTCNQCHANGIYHGTSALCYSCHQADYQGTTNPNHTQAGFPHECNTCHTINDWAGATLDHSLFPLTGGHAGRTCNQCHANGVFQGTPAACASCHEADYQGTTDPNHTQAGFPHECNTCHTINGWSPSNFDHTFFPLTGGHAGPSCNQCHANGVFQGTPAACASCHEADYQGTTDPNHTQAGFPHECSTCHTINRWRPSNFDHTSSP